MKKVLATLAAVLLCGAVSACGTDPYGMYADMERQLAQVTSLEVRVEAAITQTFGETQQQVVVSCDSRELIRSEDDVDMDMSMFMQVDGMPLGMTDIYYRDGYIYQSMSGTKTKAAFSLEEMDSMRALLRTPKILQEAVEAAEAKDTTDGREYVFTMKGDMIGEVANDLLGWFGVSGDTVIQAGNAVYTVRMDRSNMVKSYNLKMDTTVEINGETTQMSHDINYEVVNFNNPAIAVRFPDDLDTYAEMQ